MPGVFQEEGQRFEADGAQTGVSEGTELTAAGSTHTKGSYTQLVASTGFASSGLLITMGGNGNNNAAYLTDIAIGASSSEQVIVPNLFYEGAGDGHIQTFYLPVPVPAGVRLSARTQSSTASAKHRILVFPVAGGFGASTGSSRVTAYAADTSLSRGTAVATAGSTNTKGSWVQLTSATTAPMHWMLILVYVSVNTTQMLFDVGIGAGGSEVVLVANLNLRADPISTVAYAFPCRIAKGTRIAARSQAAAASSEIRLAVYGVG